MATINRTQNLKLLTSTMHGSQKYHNCYPKFQASKYLSICFILSYFTVLQVNWLINFKVNQPAIIISLGFSLNGTAKLHSSMGIYNYPFNRRNCHMAV